MLEKIKSSADLKKLNTEELTALCEEIRHELIQTVSENGGHLASNLGVVELTVALHRVYDTPEDKIVFDVGHQCYVHKMITGRYEQFRTLRKYGGISGFPKREESRYDCFETGHASTAISAALGLARARDYKKEHYHVIALTGDGAMTGGMCYEALNDAGNANTQLTVILNDNEMSISRPAGSLAKLFGRLITSIRYNRVKAAAESAGHRLRLTFLRGIYHRIESRIKSWFLSNAVFEHFGLRYIGPVDGHDLVKLKEAFTVAKEDKRSVLVHVVTRKGKGYAPAEREPTKFHGIGPFARAFAAPADGDASLKTRGWSEAMGAALVAAARRDTRIVALTAGMKDGTC